MRHLPFTPTPIDSSVRLAGRLGIRLFIKRDDLFPLSGGGNKARKLQYIMASAQERRVDAVVTAGGLQSNHVRATAVMAAKLGWKATMVIHSRKPRGRILAGNLKLTQLAGARLRFVEAKEVSTAMDTAMSDLKDAGHNPLLIPGGGHSPEGTYAYYAAVKEVRSQLRPGDYPEFIVMASGTGTTQAGIAAGCHEVFPKCKVIGVSVARETARGSTIIGEGIDGLYALLGKGRPRDIDVRLDDKFTGGGYEAVTPGVLDTIKWASANEGLIQDPTYTGKAFHALRAYVAKKKIPRGANVLFWHTGGLMNLVASKSL